MAWLEVVCGDTPLGSFCSLAGDVVRGAKVGPCWCSEGEGSVGHIGRGCSDELLLRGGIGVIVFALWQAHFALSLGEAKSHHSVHQLWVKYQVSVMHACCERGPRIFSVG